MNKHQDRPNSLPTAPILLCLTFLPWLSACSSTPFERFQTLAEAEPLHRTLRIRVEDETDGSFGSPQEWTEQIVIAFDELNVCVQVLQAAAGSGASADMEVTVRVEARTEPGAPKIDWKGAFLVFLAWSTVPLVPLWIPDVEVKPAFTVRVSMELPGGTALREGNKEIPPDPIMTTYLQRYPFLSWPTLGALFIPTFAFKSGDRDHLASAIAKQVRLEAACQVADFVKKAPLKEAGDPLQNLDLKPVGELWVLSFLPDERVGTISLRLERTAGEGSERDAPIGNPTQKTLPLRPGPSQIEEISLTDLLAGADAEGLVLRVEAQKRGESRRFGYTLSFQAGMTAPQSPAKLVSRIEAAQD